MIKKKTEKKTMESIAKIKRLSLKGRKIKLPRDLYSYKAKVTIDNETYFSDKKGVYHSDYQIYLSNFGWPESVDKKTFGMLLEVRSLEHKNIVLNMLLLESDTGIVYRFVYSNNNLLLSALKKRDRKNRNQYIVIDANENTVLRQLDAVLENLNSVDIFTTEMYKNQTLEQQSIKQNNIVDVIEV